MWVMLLAVLLAIVGSLLTSLWFGVSRRRHAEIEIGIQALARMKWRDCVALILEALQREGYRPSVDSLAAGDGGSEFLLTLNGEKVLLGYKHGTAYHLGEASVAEFANALHMRGARSGILLTLGSADAASAAAQARNVQLMDGATLWPKVRPLLPPGLLQEVRIQAAGRIRRGLWTGFAASVLAATLVYFIAGALQAPPAPVAVAVAYKPVAPAAIASDQSQPRSDAAMLRQLNASAQAMAAVARLSRPELARRRAGVAQKVSLISKVDTASWSAERTLLVTLNSTDGKDKVLADEICRIVTAHEELRFTRIQLQAPPDSGLGVRWRLCE